MRTFSYACSLPVTWKRWRLQNSICTQTYRLCVWANGSYCRSKFQIAGIGIFDLLAPVTLTLTQWPSYAIRPADRRDMPHVQIWTSCINAFEIYHLTDRQTNRHDQNYYARRFAGSNKIARKIKMATALHTLLVWVWVNKARSCLWLNLWIIV